MFETWIEFILFLFDSCYIRRIDGIHTEFDTVEVVMAALCNQGV